MALNEMQLQGMSLVRSNMGMRPYTAETGLDEMQADVIRTKKLFELFRPAINLDKENLDKLDAILNDWKSHNWKVVEQACLLVGWSFIQEFLQVLGHNQEDELYSSTRTMADFMNDCNKLDNFITSDLGGIV